MISKNFFASLLVVILMACTAHAMEKAQEQKFEEVEEIPKFQADVTEKEMKYVEKLATIDELRSAESLDKAIEALYDPVDLPIIRQKVHALFSSAGYGSGGSVAVKSFLYEKAGDVYNRALREAQKYSEGFVKQLKPNAEIEWILNQLIEEFSKTNILKGASIYHAAILASGDPEVHKWIRNKISTANFFDEEINRKAGIFQINPTSLAAYLGKKELLKLLPPKN